MLHDTLCVSGVGFLYFYCLQDNVKDQQAKQEETTWMAYRRIHGSCSPLVQDTLTINLYQNTAILNLTSCWYISLTISLVLSMTPIFNGAFLSHSLPSSVVATSQGIHQVSRRVLQEAWEWEVGEATRSGMEVGLGDVCWHVPGTFSGDFWLWNIMNETCLEHKNNSKEGQIQSKDWEILRGGGRGGWRAIWFRRSWNPPWTSGLDILFLFANYATFLNALKK